MAFLRSENPVESGELSTQNPVAAARARLEAHEVVEQLAETFAVLGDPTRLTIVLALLQTELRVGEIAQLVGLSESAISHHLRLLRALRLVKTRREGRSIYYSLDDYHIESLIATGLSHTRE